MRPYRQPLDDDSAARLLLAVVHPDDAPPGYGSVADVLKSAARLPLAPVDEERAATTIAAMVEVIRSDAPAPQASRRRSMLGKVLAGKALAAVAVVGLTATGAAAATGSLPDPVQGVVAGAVSHVGVDIPHPDHGKSAGHRQDGLHRKDGQGGRNGGDGENGGAGENGRAGETGQPADGEAGDPGKGMSQFVEDHKGGEGPLGQVVCVEASDGKCHSGADNPGKGSGTGEGTTPPGGGPSENRGKAPNAGGEAGDGATPPAADDEGDAGGQGPSTPPPNTEGLGDAATNSGKDVPAGRGKPAGED